MSLQVYKLSIGSPDGPPSFHISLQGDGIDTWLRCSSEDRANLLLTALSACGDQVEVLRSSVLEYREDPRQETMGDHIAEAVEPTERLHRLYRDSKRRTEVWTIENQGR